MLRTFFYDHPIITKIISHYNNFWGNIFESCCSLFINGISTVSQKCSNLEIHLSTTTHLFLYFKSRLCTLSLLYNKHSSHVYYMQGLACHILQCIRLARWLTLSDIQAITLLTMLSISALNDISSLSQHGTNIIVWMPEQLLASWQTRVAVHRALTCLILDPETAFFHPSIKSPEKSTRSF